MARDVAGSVDSGVFTLTNEAALGEALAQVVRDGFCVVDQELEVELRSLAVALRNVSDRVVAALNVSTQASRTSDDALRARFLPGMRATTTGMRPLLIDWTPPP